jgi:predicted AlkP superfamily phosphohydrolase/phosphomutase
MNLKQSIIVVGLLAAVVGVGVSSCRGRTEPHPKVIVIGFDGMDPRLCTQLMDAGELPNLASMRDIGGFKPLATTIPPQSPVAWASFITGANPGVHGIFDFIHRNPDQQVGVYYSAAETVGGEKGWEVGEHKIPLSFWPFNHPPTQTLLKRDGVPFWDYLDKAGIPIRIYDIPANYPPSPSHHGHMCCLSGMGVPDLRGGYGEYQFFSEKTIIARSEAGGMRKPLLFKDHYAKARLVGPVNSYLKKPADTFFDFEIHRHPTASSARVDIQGQHIILNEGEWSDWVRLQFELAMPPFLPNAHASGIVRLYLQEVHPELSLYVTPINIDPSDPSGAPITEPPSFIKEISQELGLFYTAGFQEDHKALSNRVFSDAEYRFQADYVLKERLELLEYARKNYNDGLLFFYFSSTDLQAHMFWWDTDEKHPTRSAEKAQEYHRVIVDLYKRADAIVGDMMERYGDQATIMVMSDHGFANFRRQFDLNTWLRDEGYIQPPNCRSLLGRPPLVDWTQTRAYGIGLNGLYLNLLGRERDGIVNQVERDALLDEITEKLLSVRDPENGAQVIARVYRRDDVYQGPNALNAPDLIVGYSRGYRVSWGTTLGDISGNVLSDNTEAWSADHCIAAEEVPGVIFTNRPIAKPDPALTDMAPTILKLFGLEAPPTMAGGDLFTPTVTAQNATGQGQEVLVSVTE